MRLDYHGFLASLRSAILRFGLTAAIALFVISAYGFELNLDGSVLHGGDALYAVNRDGREVKLAQVGTVIRDSAELVDLGAPSVAPDGTILFGAATASNHQVRWSIFVAAPDSGTVVPLSLPLRSQGRSELIMVADPQPRPTDDGDTVFEARDSRGHDAVFKLSHGNLRRLLQTGERLTDASVIRAIAYGSVQPESGGLTALIGYLDPGGQAEILVSDDGKVKVLARENQKSPTGAHFRKFGHPAIGILGGQPIVVFTARTDRGTALFRFANGKLNEVLSGSTPCQFGKIDYLSDGSPGLDGHGVVAVVGSCKGAPGIYLVNGRTTRLLISSREVGSYGATFEYLGDPLLFRSGHVLFGARTSDGETSLFDIFQGEAVPIISFGKPKENIAHFSVGDRHTIEVSRMSVNRFGLIAYLGSP